MRVQSTEPLQANRAPANDRFPSQAAPARNGGPLRFALTAGLSLWRAAERLYNEMRNRHAMEHMLELDDALLRDMGVTRADVRRAMHLPIVESAGENLAKASLRSRSV